MLPLYKPEDYKRVLETALLVAGDPWPFSPTFWPPTSLALQIRS